MSATILIAEDEAPLRDGLVATLESEGYDVVAVPNGQAAIDTWNEGAFDVVILDVMMPEKSGFDVCRAIRANNERVPVMMLTAKGEEVDKVVGLELGADDYMTKPFGVRELLARVAALLRRSALADGAKAERKDQPPTFTFGEASIDRRQYQVTLGEQTHPLTAREMALLETLSVRPQEVLDRDTLLNDVWGLTYYGTTRTFDQHIAQLRKKVEVDPKKPATIVTVHGVGYKYCPPDAD